MSQEVFGRVAAEQALATIPGFSGASIGSRLSHGPTNTSFQLELAGEHYVLRVDKPGTNQLGLNRRNEQQVSGPVAGAGLAPEPVYSDLDAGIYVRRYLPGRSWSAADLSSAENLDRLAALLRKLHSLPLTGGVFDPLAAARNYAGELNSNEARSILLRAEMLMEKIREERPQQALCHNDLVCQNILEGVPLMLIDWEYAAVGDPFFDLAIVVRHDDLAPTLASRFLNSYLGRTAGAREKERLELQCEFYACLLSLWNLRVADI